MIIDVIKIADFFHAENLEAFEWFGYQQPAYMDLKTPIVRPMEHLFLVDVESYTVDVFPDFIARMFMEATEKECSYIRFIS